MQKSWGKASDPAKGETNFQTLHRLTIAREICEITRRAVHDPLTLHAALGSFENLFQAVAAGTPLTSCVLKAQGSNGGTIQFTFTYVYVRSNVTTAATSGSLMAPRTAYVDATLLYSAIAVTQTGSTVGDGGTS